MKEVHFAMAAAMALAIAAFLGAACSVPDADAGDAGAEYEGTCGQTGAANWAVDDDVLTISGTGSVAVLKDISSTARWSDCGWTLKTESRSASNASPTPEDVFKGVKKIVISTSGAIEAQALNILPATSISFGTSHTNVEERLFDGNSTVTAADLKNVAVINKEAFKGCTSLDAVSNATAVTEIKESAFEGCASLKAAEFSEAAFAAGSFKGCTALETINVGKTASLDLTAFEGCSMLSEINVDSANTTYCAVGGLVYTKDKATLYMCPNAKTGNITEVEPAVRTINLGYADVSYLLDGSALGNAEIKFASVAGAKAIAVVYYKQAIDGDVLSNVDGSTFTMTYNLYSGWTVDMETAKVVNAEVLSATDTELKFQVAEGNGYLAYPVGKSVVTYDDLMKDNINGWKVRDVVLTPSYQTGETIAEIESYSCTICGYSGTGTAILGESLKNWGALCKVDSMAEGDYSSMIDLEITGNLELKEGAFANSRSLKTLNMPEVEKVPKGVFRYCTSLESVEMGSCTEIDEYAFEGCVSLSKMRIWSSSVSISESAFNNCTSLKVIQAAEDSEVDGWFYPIVVYCNSTDVEFRLVGLVLIVEAEGMESLTCGLTTYEFYKSSKGGIAAIDFYSDSKIELHPGTPNDKCLIVLESNLWIGAAESMVVDSGSKLDGLKDLSGSGVIFKGWYDENGKRVTSETTVTESMVLTGAWEREVSTDKTAIHLLTFFGIAVLGSVIVIVISRYK